jgi:hypothetical protein
MRKKKGDGFINNLVYGYSEYTKSSNQVLKNYGNEIIQKITIFRQPLNSFYLFVANRLAKHENYDKLFHLYIIVNTSKGNVLIEKNETINITNHIKNNKDTDKFEINNFPKITINQLLENTKKIMGKNYFSYSAKNNNCQDFIINILRANNINDKAAYEFTKQNVEDIFKSHHEIRKSINTLTDIANRLQVIRQEI